MNELRKDLILAAVGSTEGEGLLSSGFVKKIAGLTGDTLRTYANQLAKEGVLVKKYEPIPGRPYDGNRARYWLPEYYEE